jgi:hypothetical protein
MPRCCEPIAREFVPSYASVLVHGKDPDNLDTAVRGLEAQPLVSCFTAWCPRCSHNYMLTRDVAEFPTPSAHHTHQLQLLAILRESGAFFGSGS